MRESTRNALTDAINFLAGGAQTAHRIAEDYREDCQSKGLDYGIYSFRLFSGQARDRGGLAVALRIALIDEGVFDQKLIAAHINGYQAGYAEGWDGHQDFIDSYHGSEEDE